MSEEIAKNIVSAEVAEVAEGAVTKESAATVASVENPSGIVDAVDDQVPSEESEAVERAKMIAESETLMAPETSEVEAKIRESAKGKYTPEELDGIIKMGKKMASKAVLSMLISVIEEGPARGLDSGECKKLTTLIRERMPFDYCGFLQCEFAEIDYKLNISLTLAERGYCAEISVPDAKYANDLYRQYNFLKSIAAAYWQQFTEDYKALYKRICEYRSDVNFSELVVDKDSPTTLYFDPGSKMRVGIFPYYVNAQGKPLRKK